MRLQSKLRASESCQRFQRCDATLVVPDRALQDGDIAPKLAHTMQDLATPCVGALAGLNALCARLFLQLLHRPAVLRVARLHALDVINQAYGGRFDLKFWWRI